MEGRTVGERKWIAVVDDDISVRTSLARLLRSEGSGFELQERLAATDPDLPVIFIIAHDEISSAEMTRRVGPDGHLRKPFDGEALLAMVRRRLRQRPAGE